MRTRFSGRLTSSKLIAGPNAVPTGCYIDTDGSNNVAIVLYDGQDAMGTEIWRGTLVGPAYFGGTDFPFDPNAPMAVSEGLYLTISGTGGGVNVHYVKERT